MEDESIILERYSKKKNCSRHLILNILLFIIGIPAIITSIFISIFGFSCVFFYHNVIQMCSSPLLKISSTVSQIIISINYTTQSFLCLITCLFLGRYGLESASHHIRLKFKRKYQLTCCSFVDFRTLIAYFYYFFPSLILIIEAYWKFIIQDHNLFIFFQVSISIFLTTWLSMTIFPMLLNDPHHLFINNELTTTELRPDRLDPTNLNTDLLTPSFEPVFNGDDESNENVFDTINSEFIESMDLDEFSFFCCCSYKYRPRFTWLPLFLITFFIMNLSWLFYDSSYLVLHITTLNTMKYWQLKFVLSCVNIYYRWQQVYGYLRKLLYPDIIVPFNTDVLENYKTEHEYSNYIYINGERMTDKIIHIHAPKDINTENQVMINDKVCFDRHIHIDQGKIKGVDKQLKTLKAQILTLQLLLDEENEKKNDKPSRFKYNYPSNNIKNNVSNNLSNNIENNRENNYENNYENNLSNNSSNNFSNNYENNYENNKKTINNSSNNIEIPNNNKNKEYIIYNNPIYLSNNNRNTQILDLNDSTSEE